MTRTANRAPTPRRRPLDLDHLHRVLAEFDLTGPVDFRSECESTNDVARQLPIPAAVPPAAWGLVVAESQTAGRGRIGRTWESPVGASLLFSLALAAPADVDANVVGVTPLAAGVAVAEVCHARGAKDVVLKWPNDVVLADTEVDGLPRKLGGILAERAPDRVIVGIGLNIDLTAEEAPTPQAASLRDHGLNDEVTREELLARIVAELVSRWRELLVDGPTEVLDRFTHLCSTLGQQVQVSTPGSRQVTGEAVGIDPAGRLVVRASDGQSHTISAGDVTRVRGRDT